MKYKISFSFYYSFDYTPSNAVPWWCYMDPTLGTSETRTINGVSLTIRSSGGQIQVVAPPGSGSFIAGYTYAANDIII